MTYYTHNVYSTYKHCVNMFAASEKGCIDCLTKFIDSKVTYIDLQDVDGNTALHCLLMVLRLYVDSEEKRFPEVRKYLTDEYTKCIKILLANGLNPEIKNNLGETCYDILDFKYLIK